MSQLAATCTSHGCGSSCSLPTAVTIFVNKNALVLATAAFASGCMPNAPDPERPPAITLGPEARNLQIHYAVEPAVSDNEALFIYEAALRHQLKMAHQSPNKSCYIFIEGEMPPKALLLRFSRQRPRILAGHPNMPEGSRWYALQLGTTVQDHSSVLGWDSEHHFMRVYDVVRRSGQWEVVSDSILAVE